jgi:hypothetical protein
MRTAVYELTTNEYLNDEIPGVSVPTLSASIAKVLDTQSPRHAYARHPKLGGSAPRHTDATDEGTALHSMLLGAGREVVLVECEMEVEKAKGRGADKTPARREIVKPANYLTNAAKARRDPFLAKDFDRLVKSARELRLAFQDADISLEGDVEQTVLWVETADDGTEVQCKGMLDLVDWSTGRILDLKKTENAHPDAIARHVDDWGYAIQQAAYVRGVEAVRPQLAGRVAKGFSFAFYELDPVLVTQRWLDGTYRQIGETRWRRAVNTWARCLRTGKWPGYPPGPVAPPGWVMAREEARELAEGAQEGRAA